MNQCQECQGFVPSALRACPHCETSQPQFKKGLKRASQLLIGASITLTLSACYGVPPSSIPACEDDIPNQGTCQGVPGGPQLTPNPSPSASGSPTTTDTPPASDS